MKPPGIHHLFVRRRRPARAFTVVELLVAVSVMTVIVLVLYRVFNETQRALRSNITQVDVLEAGRAAMELMTRELQELAASHAPNQTNFYVELAPTQITQILPVSGGIRTNVLEDFFFLTRRNKDFSGIGYRVINANIGVGTLARFDTRTNIAANLPYSNLSLIFKTNSPIPAQNPTNFHRVADGIIHLRLLAYDADGRSMTLNTADQFYSQNVPAENRYARIDFTENGRPARGLWIASTNVYPPNVVIRQNRGETEVRYMDGALPAYVELELGILEPQTLDRFKSLLNPEMARKFLEERPGSVHLFRQRIPIRTASR